MDKFLYGFGFIIYIYLLVLQVESKGKLSINLIDYRNPQGHDYNGTCCDGGAHVCTLDKCDYVFTICVGENSTDCFYGEQIVTSPVEHNDVLFNQTSVVPVEFGFDKWKGGASITISVADADSDGVQTLVDQFNIHFNHSDSSVNSPTLYNLRGSRPNSPTRLQLTVKTFCEDNYYGSECSVNCVDQISCDGMYTCDSNGNKKCKNGWTGTKCNQVIFGGDADCSKGEQSFIPSLWEGQYSCPNGPDQNLELRVSKSAGSIQTKATFSLDSVSVNASGSYGSFSRSLLLEGDTVLSNGTYLKVRLEGTQVNQTDIQGVITINGTQCALKHLRLKEAYADTCDNLGTCFKIQQQKYCCCNDGDIKYSCALSTTTKLTTITTKKPTTAERTSTPSTTTSLPTTTKQTTENPTTMIETTTTLQTTKSTTTLAPVKTTITVSETTEAATTESPTTTVTTPETTSVSPTTTPPTTTTASTTPVTTRPVTTRASTVATTRKSTIATTMEATVATTRESTVATTDQTTTEQVLTTQAQTTSSTTVSTSIPSTTTIATTTTLKPIQPSKPYTLILTLVEDEKIDKTILDVIQQAWYEVNKGLAINKSSVAVTEITQENYIVEEIEHRGYEVVSIQYKINITTVTNASVVKVPLNNQTQVVLDQNYHGVTQYDGILKYLYRMNSSYSLYIMGPGPRDNQIEQLQMAIFEAFNRSCNNSECNTLNETEISIKMTEEYVGLKGEEVTRVYFYLLHWGNVVTNRLTTPTLEMYKMTLRVQNTKLQMYEGNIEDLLRYRFHYQLLVIGEVFDDDLKMFQKEIQDTWVSYSIGHTNDCKQCNVTIVRKEKYVGDHGEMLTSLVYFVKSLDKVEMPVIQSGPDVTLFNVSIDIIDQNRRRYQLYTGHVWYRYTYLYHLLIMGRVDNHDNTNILVALKAAMRAYTPSSKYTVSFSGLEEQYYSKNGVFVTNIMCLIAYNNHTQDSRLIDVPSMTWLSQWLKSNYTSALVRQSGQPYSIYTTQDTWQLYITQNLFTIYINGYFMYQNEIEVEANLELAWDAVVNDSLSTVDIIKEIIYIDKQTGETVTGLLYTLHLNNKVVMPAMIKEESRYAVYNLSTTLLAQMNTSYNVYAVKSHLLDFEQHFELYFTTKIATIDLKSKVLPKILSVLQHKWNDDVNKYSNIQIHLGFQERVYLQNLTTVWRLVFFLTSNKYQINPSFTRPIISYVQNISITGINKHVYKIITGHMSSVQFYYRDHFTLTFTREVSHLDWVIISNDLKARWCQVLNCSVEKVDVVIKGQEKYIDVTGKLYWRLIYFVRHGRKLISSRHRRSVKTHDFKWNSIYGGNYQVVSKIEREIHRYSYAFQFYTDVGILYTVDMIKKMEKLLLDAWYDMNIVSKSCKCLQIIGMPQQHISIKSGSSVWRFTYFIKRRDQEIIDASVWPRLNTSLVDLSIITTQKIHILSSFNWLYYQYMLKFYSQYKIPLSMYSKIEAAMTETWLKENPDYKACGCIHVKITSQEEVIDSQGHSHWLVHYHIQNKGKPMNPATIKPFNWTLFNIDHNFSSSFGHHFKFSWSWNQKEKYVHLTDTGKLHINTWVPPSMYSNFQSWLQWYYQHYYSQYYKDTDVSVELTNTSKEYLGKEGSSSWKLPFILKLNGSITNPPPINSSVFEATFNYTAPNGKEYKTVTDNTVTDSKLYFSVLLNNKVSTSVLEKMKEALISAWSKQHPDIDPATLNVTFGNQEEVLNTNTTGKSAWKLSYTISINGTKVDTRSTVKLNSTILAPYLNITGPNNMTYEVIHTDSSSFISSSHLYSLYFKSYVSTEDRKVIEEQIAGAWRRQHNSTSERISVSFLKQKEYVNSKGESLWKWDYVLKFNNTNVRNAAVMSVNIKHLQTAIDHVTSVTGKKYSIVDSLKNFYVYAAHFPLYVSTKVDKKDLQLFKIKLQNAWSSLGWKGVTVDIANQEEMVEKQSGKSVWRLAYFVKKNSTLVDSRVTENLKKNKLPVVDGPRGLYVFLTDLDVQKYLTYQFSGSFAVNTKFGVDDHVKVQHILKQLIQENLTESNTDVEVEVNRQEEYLMKNGTKGWHTLYFVKLNGQYIPVFSLANLNTDQLENHLSNLTSPHGIQLRVVNKKDLIYSYRNEFYVYFTTKVASQNFAKIKELIHTTLNSTNPDYENCSCLTVEEIKDHHVEEVIDKKGNSYWQLVYYLRKNGTLLESMTHKSLNHTYFNMELTKLMGPKKKAYKVVGLKKREITRLSMMFSFHLCSNIGYKDQHKFEESIKSTWIRSKRNFFTKTSLSVSINRRVRYVDLTNRKTIWKVEYTLKKDSSLVDPLVLPELSMKELEKNLTFHGPKGSTYELVKSVEAVDYRWHFEVVINREIRTTDFTRFSKAVEQYWNSTNSGESVTIPFQENLVDKTGNFYWRLVIFWKQTTGYVDSRTRADINTTDLQSYITFKGVNGHNYSLISSIPTSVRRYDASFSLMLSKTIRTVDLTHISTRVSQLWKEKEFRSNIVSVEIWRQENYISLQHGLVTKVIYYISVDNSTIHSSQVPYIDTDSLKMALSSLNTTSQQYTITNSTNVYRYDHQFTLILTETVLKQDIRNLENHLSATWKLQEKESWNWTVKILLQAEFVAVSTGQTVVKVLYAVSKNKTTLSSNQVDSLKEATVKANLNSTRTGTGKKYKELVFTGSSNLTRYDDLFYFMVDTRVAIQDYSNFESQLKSAWISHFGSSQRVKSVKIVKQETVVPKKGSLNAKLFKLSYSLTSSDKNYKINRQLVKDLSEKVLQNAINVTSPLGKKYTVSMATNGYRLSQFFWVLINRQLYNSDSEKFADVLSHVIKTNIKASASVKLNFLKTSRSRVVDANTGDILWQYGYIADINGVAVDAAYQPAISHSSLSNAVNFTSPRNETYNFINKPVVSYKDLFHVQIVGRPSVEIVARMKSSLSNIWRQHSGKTINISTIVREEYIGSDGYSVTSYKYIAKSNGTVVYPSITQPPSYNTLASEPGLTLYQESNQDTHLYRYKDLYKVYVQSQKWSINTTQIHTALQQAWSSNGYSNLTFNMVKQTETFVGTLGLTLNAVLYTVREETSSQVLTPYFAVEPDISSIKQSLTDQKSRVIIYSPESQPVYRVQVLFQVNLRHTQNTGLKKHDIQLLQLLMEKGWQNVTNDNGFLANFVSRVEYIAMNSSTKISRFYYSIKQHGKSLQSWQTGVSKTQIGAALSSLIQKNVTLFNKVAVTSQTAAKVHTVFINGKLTTAEQNQVKTSITNSWTSKLQGSDISVKIISSERYVNSQWNDVSNVKYTITVNGSDSDQLNITPPSHGDLDKELTKIGKSQCSCMANKPRKKYVDGKTSSFNIQNIQNAIKTVWSNKVSEVKSSAITINVKKKSTRRKRDANPGFSTPRLVGNNDKEISPLHYTVGIQDQEPDSAFVDSPTDQELDQPLSNAGVPPCHCTPKLAGKVTLEGNSDDKDKPKIADAIEDAFVKENPGVQKNDLDTKVELKNTKDQDGKPVTDVSYKLSKQTGDDIEDLKAPTEITWQNSLNTAGKTLHSRAPLEPEKDESWKLPVAVACGILAFILVILIICYAVYIRKRSKKENLIKRGDQVTTRNSFDKEHFSDAASVQVYDNQSYDEPKNSTFKSV